MPVGSNTVQIECSKQARGNAPVFTPGKSAAAALSLLIRKKPQEFDGRISWEAYRGQFELLAARNNWDDMQCAVHLATSLKGA